MTPTQYFLWMNGYRPLWQKKSKISNGSELEIAYHAGRPCWKYQYLYKGIVFVELWVKDSNYIFEGGNCCE